MEEQVEQRQQSTRKRLKDSCNSCGLTKVRCNKAKPSCSRCVDRGIYCHYSPSQRSGRKAASASQNRSSVAPKALPSQASANDDYCGPQSSISRDSSQDNASFLEFLSSSLDGEFLNFPEPPQLSTSTLNTGGFDPVILSSPNHLFGDGGANLESLDSFLNRSGLKSYGSYDSLNSILSSQPKHNQSSPPTPQSLHESGQNQLFASGKGNTEKPHSCLVLALNIIAVLHIPQSTCILISPPSNRIPSLFPTFDFVISTNRSIIEAMNKMLTCPCSLDEQFASVMCPLFLKVLAWYSAAAKEVDNKEDHRQTSVAPERVLHSPVTVGKYRLEGIDARWMRAQLILSELQRMVRLVDHLTRRLAEGRLCGGRQDSLGANRWISGSIFSQMEVDLKRRLKAVTEETMAILRGNQ